MERGEGEFRRQSGNVKERKLPAAENCREETKRKQFSQTVNTYAIIVTQINKYLSYKAVQRTWTSVGCALSKCEDCLILASQRDSVSLLKEACDNQAGYKRQVSWANYFATLSLFSVHCRFFGTLHKLQQCSVLFRYCLRE